MGINKDDFWFKHTYGQRANDEEAALIAAYGAEGYGVLNILKEMLHQAEDSRVEYSEKRMKRIAGYCKMPYDRLNAILDDCFHVFDIFLLKDGYIVSPEVEENKIEREQFRSKRVNSGKKGGEASANKKRASGSKNEASATDIQASAAEKGSKSEQTTANRVNNAALANQVLEENENIQASATENGSKIEQTPPHNIRVDNSGEHNTSPPSDEEGEDRYISADLLKKYEKEHWIGWKNRDKIIRGKADFTKMVAPFVKKYGQEVCNRFWKYWTEPSTNKSGKLRWEAEKFFDLDARLGTFKNDKK